MNDYVHQVSDEEADRIQRFLYILAAGSVAFVVIVIIAIMTASRWLTLVSPDSERRFIEPYIEWADSHLFQSSDPELQNYVAELGRQIAVDMDLTEELQIEFRVIEGDAFNAFTMLGGYIFVFDGLLRKLDSENGLAMVLAHEIAHAKNRDPLLAAGRGVLLQILISSLSGSGTIEASTTETGSALMLNVYSREQEEAADRLALAALYDHYGHVGGATQIFVAIRDSGSEPETMQYLSSHPGTQDRIDYLQAMASDKGWASGYEAKYPDNIRNSLANPP